MVELTWRVTNDDGLCWHWPTREQAEAQVALWESQGDRGFITPVFRRDGIELTDEGLAEWIAAANKALTIQAGTVEAEPFARPSITIDNGGNGAAAFTDSFLRNGYVITTALVVEQYSPGAEVTLSILNSRQTLATGFIRIHSETLIRLAEKVVANRALFLSSPKEGNDG